MAKTTKDVTKEILDVDFEDTTKAKMLDDDGYEEGKHTYFHLGKYSPYKRITPEAVQRTDYRANASQCKFNNNLSLLFHYIYRRNFVRHKKLLQSSLSALGSHLRRTLERQLCSERRNYSNKHK